MVMVKCSKCGKPTEFSLNLERFVCKECMADYRKWEQSDDEGTWDFGEEEKDLIGSEE